MIGRVSALTAAMALGFAAAAQAEPDYAHQGAYLQFDGLLAVANDQGFGGTSTDTVTGGFSIKAGIDIVDYVSAEIEFQTLPGDDIKVITAQQRVRILTGQWQPYLLAGIGWGRASKANHFAVRIGGGLDYMITEHWSTGLTANYLFLLANSPVDGPNFATFGLGVRYGF